MSGQVLDTVLGAIKVCPECKVQAVCVNGSKCWEAGRCLKAVPAARVELEAMACLFRMHPWGGR